MNRCHAKGSPIEVTRRQPTASLAAMRMGGRQCRSAMEGKSEFDGILVMLEFNTVCQRALAAFVACADTSEAKSNRRVQRSAPPIIDKVAPNTAPSRVLPGQVAS